MKTAYNMKQKILLAATVLCCLSMAELRAQASYDVLVKSAFNPVIQDAQKKINFPARIVDTVQARAPMEYNVQTRPLSTRFTPEPIKAPRVGKDPVTKLYQHYLKAGIGYLQPLLEYDFNTLRSTRHSFGLHLYSHSSWNQVSQCAPSSYSENTFGLHAQQFREKFHLREEAGYAFDHYHCYGYHADSMKKTFDWDPKAKDIARYYHRGHAAFEAFTPSTRNSLKLNRSYKLDYSFLLDNLHSQEHRGTVGINLDKRLMVSRTDMFRLGGDISAEYAHNYWDTLRKAYDAWIFRAAPYMRLEEGAWKLKLGLAVSVGLEGNEPDAAIFPDIHANLDIVPEILSVHAGADGGMRRDAFQTLSRDNPYLAPMLDLKTDKLYRLFVGTKTNLSNSLVFGARIGMEMHSALSCYIPDTTPVAWRDTTAIRLFNTFGIQHTKTSLTNLHMDVTYHYRESLQISSNLDYYSYSTPDSVTLYYKPQYSIGISAAYLWKDKIRIGTDIAWKGGAFAPEYTADGSYGKVSLPDWFDWSLNAEYLWNRRLRFFAEFNNLTGRRNQLYAGYYTERFNCLFGLKYLFGGE